MGWSENVGIVRHNDDMDLESVRLRLLQLREELRRIESTGNAAAATVELDQTRVGRLSRMDALQSQAMSKESQRRNQAQRVRVEAALRRIDAGDYGKCLECGETIHPGRLSVDPTTTLCIECAEALER